MEEISGYLRPVYDCKAVFSATGDDRNRLIVMYTADIALYHMVAIVPDLPTVTEDDGPVSNSIIYHSAPRLRHDW